MSSQHFECHIDVVQNGDNPVELFAEASGLSKQRIKSAMLKGAAWLTSGKHTRRLRRQAKPMKTGDKLHLYYDEKILATEPQPAKLVSDEGAYSVWHKPRGMLSQGSKWSDHCTIYRWAEQHLQPERNGFIVHRLDRAASGLILVAHQKKVATALARLFQERSITKRYQVKVATALARLFQERSITKRYQVIVHGQFPDREQTLTIASEIDGRPARSHARLIEHDPELDRSRLEISIDIGRKYQIHRHLASIGFPVVGDRLYGDKDDSADLQLTACYLAFTCLVSNQPKAFELPEELKPTLRQNG
ncbi:RluA family pseudouridine synthase [Solemya velesiana gill symbiont]|uniref:Pseudouridine synthase RsuA/RluA-like domain-containing protein n=1 Tax=Solemya velesiana gill symbiont TaxID=1918948 RepID=A0A1T2KS28_9GAMM|nr:RNA pseudouridine synthase [Solemya velesiana gill symbiont]OOZ35657.1 hypothetical protein BOW51_11015 [Solemya velesiana gill symbiont]